jgi:CMP-N,N'-diacetyllegionaminic acid synthase
VEVLALIPARGGSKGLPNKNILPMLGHPLIAYSVKAGLDSKYVTRVIVSTDSPAIAEVAKAYGAEIPFMRPDELAQDYSLDFDVFLHALNWLKENENYVPDYIVQLRPTTPVRTVGMIDECLERLLRNPQADSLRVITPSPLTPYKLWTITDEEHPMEPLLRLPEFPESFNEPRQRLPKTYWHTGTLDIIKPDIITQQKLMSGKIIMPYIMEEQLAVDIDTLEDFKKAEQVITEQACIKF